MASTSTTRLALLKPTAGTSEPVNVTTQLDANWDKIDASIGATICTSSTRPASPWDGQIIKETDTRRMYIRNAATSSWDQIVVSTTGTASTDSAIISTGRINWDNGSGTPDTNIYRGGANQLKTDDDFNVVGTLTVGGSKLYRATITAGSTLANFDFTSIPTDLKLLQLSWTARSTDTGFMTQSLHMRINNVSTASTYRSQVLQSAGTGTSASTNTGAAPNGDNANIGFVNSNGAAAGAFGSGAVQFGAWNHSGYLGWNFQSIVFPTDVNMWKLDGGGVYTGAGPYNRITIYPDLGSFMAGSQCSLVGWS